MNAGVLSNVKAREVETEHLDLADHIPQVAGGGEAARTGDQRALDAAQVLEQLGRDRVALGDGVAHRGAHALAHEGQRAAIGLLGVQRGERRGELGKIRGSGVEDRVQVGRRAAHAV